MSANLNSMFYYGEKPWHGLGKSVSKALTSAEAIDMAGLNWSVRKEPIFLKGVENPIPGKYAVVREDNRTPLGVIGKLWKPLQNREAFSFFDAIVGVKEAMYHTAGALGQGERIWLLAKLPGYVQVTKDDVTEKYLLLTNSHEGGTSIQVMFSPIRVVCQNTLNIALANGSNKASISHMGDMGMKIDEVQKTLGIVNQRFTLFEEAAKQLVKTKFKSTDIKKYIAGVGLIPKAADGDELSQRAKNIIEDVSRLFETGLGTDLPGVRGSAWGAVNAVVEYVDHKRGKDAMDRTNSLLFGTGAAIKQKAWDQAMELVGVRP